MGQVSAASHLTQKDPDMSGPRPSTEDARSVSPSDGPVPAFPLGTLIATPEGNRPIEDLTTGDRVLTRDGPKRIARMSDLRLTRADWAFAPTRWPVRVPVGSLGNPRPMRLAPDQRIILSGPAFEATAGVPEVAVRVGELVGLRGLIVERPLGDLRYCGVSFGIPVVIRVEGAACIVDPDRETTMTRDAIRVGFRAMHAACEPPLYPF